MKNTSYFTIVISIFFLTTSCNKDFKLFEDYKDITIAYGLINIEDSITYLRIEKAFLTYGDMYESAQIADSNLFPYKLDVRIEKENTEIIFDTITIFNKKGGIFYAPKMQVYYAVTKGKFENLDPIKLVIKNPKTNEYATSEIMIYDASRLKIISPTNYISFDTSIPEKLFINFNTIQNTRLYQVAMRLYYMEVDPQIPESCIYKHIDYYLEEQIALTTDGTERLSITYNIDALLAAVSNGIPSSTTLERYWSDEMELSVNTANEDFMAYQQSTSSDYSIIMYRKTYSNIENGYGLFACRAIKTKVFQYDNRAKTRIKNIEGLNFKGSIEDYEDNN
ncbi:DUF4249 family protein [Lentimicrobium sp. L6]|uniref:DUF4249 family protein n=1 Tax=Lentimicrobium sp. L6 TaxID=2735916 RepID=UPI001551DF4D|nr:DUF4249 family protein [Lentimicrobium sp. L6]NPD84920.1 DUF4249 family protein [Lentimicrobium sp. L6]